MRRSILATVIGLCLVTTGCGPKGPQKGAAPPPTRASLTAEGQAKVKRAIAMVEEIEQIRGIPSMPEPEATPAEEEAPKGKKGKKGAKAAPKPAAPVAAPAPPGMDASTVAELDRQLGKAREAKEAIVALREELAESLEKAVDPVEGKDLQAARAILRRMSERIGDLRDCKNRAVEMKPKEPEKKPEKAAAKPLP
jgi:ribosomal protein S21